MQWQRNKALPVFVHYDIRVGEDEKITKHHTNNHATCRTQTRKPKKPRLTELTYFNDTTSSNSGFYKDVQFNGHDFSF
jgi:hypothetical protein